MSYKQFANHLQRPQQWLQVSGDVRKIDASSNPKNDLSWCDRVDDNSEVSGENNTMMIYDYQMLQNDSSHWNSKCISGFYKIVLS